MILHPRTYNALFGYEGCFDSSFDSSFDSKPDSTTDSKPEAESDVKPDLKPDSINVAELIKNYRTKQSEKDFLLRRLSQTQREFDELCEAQTGFEPTRNQIEYIENSITALENEMTAISDQLTAEQLYPDVDIKNILTEYI